LLRKPATASHLYSRPFAGYFGAAAEGIELTAEVLDTWNISVTAVPGTITLSGRTDNFLGDKDGRSIALPGKPHMAIRVKRLKERLCWQSTQTEMSR
jgi:hypothetical protein